MIIDITTPKHKTKFALPEDIRQWGALHFVMYFSKKWRESGGEGLTIPHEAWAAFGGRVSEFRRQTGISNQHYKEFIDDVVDEFPKRKMDVVFGSIVSKKVYNMVTTWR